MPSYSEMKLYKKMQFGGWSKRPFKEVRKALDRFYYNYDEDYKEGVDDMSSSLLTSQSSD